MKMHITHHCDSRMAERGRRTMDIRVILKYGRRHRRLCLMTRGRVNAAIRRIRGWLSRHSSARFQKRAEEARVIIRLLERAANWMVVFAEGKESVSVITVFRTGRNARRKFAVGASVQ